MLSLALLAAACTDDTVSVIESPEEVKVKGDLVFLSAGTTENSVSTRAAGDGKTYYMPENYRFVCKMYFKTDVSGEKYDLDRSQTAWMKVELDHGNSLYWNKAYSLTPTESTGGPDNDGLDTYRNDYYASKFYWQNRRQHAFLAYTDLNKTAAALKSGGPVYNGNDLNFDLDSSEDYIYKTGTKKDQWVDKNFTMTGAPGNYTSLKAIIDKVITNYSSVVTDEFKAANGDMLTGSDYESWPSEYYRYANNDKPVKIYARETPEEVDDDHQNLWYVLKFFDPATRTEFTQEQGVSYSDEQHYGYEYKVRGDLLVAVKDGDTYYLCDRNGDFIYDENDPRVTVFVKLAQTFEDNVEVVNTVAAKRYDLRGKGKSSFNSMSEQPDIVMAWEPDHVPTSAIMEDNRVDLYFKHQFSQVQVNIKNSADNSVSIDAGQIEKVELLGVTDYGYVFPYLDTDEQGTQFVRGSAFQEVVAADYSNEVLDDNPYGTYFNMFDRTMTAEDTEINKFIKSFEGITYGRLQAIRITWRETGYKDPVTQEDKEGIEHKSTYRVPETNDQGQPLRLLERGKKYIWNMELRRGTLAVIRTEIIPWAVNNEYYEVDGSIVKTTTGQ